jgi:hypothetical protein
VWLLNPLVHPAGTWSSYFNETNVIEYTINQNPSIALATPVEITRDLVFHSFLETIPPCDSHLSLFKSQLAVSVRSEVILLGAKLKLAILSVHSFKNRVDFLHYL